MMESSRKKNVYIELENGDDGEQKKKLQKAEQK